jgi:hypothetical protein
VVDHDQRVRQPVIRPHHHGFELDAIRSGNADGNVQRIETDVFGAGRLRGDDRSERQQKGR